MLRHFTIAALLLAIGTAVDAQAGVEERTATWPDGAIKLRYTVDLQGRRHGVCEAFAADGTRTLYSVYAHGLRDGAWKEWTAAGKKVRSQEYKDDKLHGHSEEFHDNGSTAAVGDYRDGLRTGKWVEMDDSGNRRRTSEYRDGRLHGQVRIQQKEHVLSKQTWKDGELQLLDDLQPFPVPKGQLRAELRAILALPPPALDPKDAHAADRAAALRRLQAYRHLCGLPFADMTLVPEWNLRCDAGAEICRLLGHLDHTPPRPPDMDEARYRLGYDGTSHSNLAINRGLPQSVDSYMDDSDPSNIDRIGHRRWCLNPVMLKTGFGSDHDFHAMWSMDGSGRAPKGLAAVYYPPRGYVPVDLFGARHAFSISLLHGTVPKRDELHVSVHQLDDEYLPTGEVLPLDWCAVAGGGFGGLQCLVFRPVGIAVEAGKRYLVEVSGDGGKTLAHRYVVEFCTALGITDDEAR
jgi:hypothetical protein